MSPPVNSTERRTRLGCWTPRVDTADLHSDAEVIGVRPDLLQSPDPAAAALYVPETVAVGAKM